MSLAMEPRLATEPLSLGVRLVNLLAVVLPIAGLVTAIVITWGWGVHWEHLATLLGMAFITAVGVTVGYHRLFTHRSFETVRPIKFILGVFGSMSLEGPLLRWVATHRLHHQLSDVEGDPHSPHLHGESFWQMLQGLFHAHVGWIFSPIPADLPRYVGDLKRDRMLRGVSNLFVLWAAIGLLLPALIGFAISRTWTGALLGFIWGGLVRVFFVHHMTWSINSVCHFWGGRPFRSDDHSRNNIIFGYLGLGEGWHNNHHAFPTSARHGLRWWQFDASWILIRTLQKLGLAWNVRLPSPEAIAAKMQ